MTDLEPELAYASLADQPGNPICEQAWTLLASTPTDTPEQRYAVDRRLQAFLETIKPDQLRLHYQAFFRQKRAARYLISAHAAPQEAER